MPPFSAVAEAECFQNFWWDEEANVFRPRPPEGDTGGLDTDAEPDDYFSDALVGTNEGWLREGSVVIPVIVSEGDPPLFDFSLIAPQARPVNPSPRRSPACRRSSNL